MLAAAKVGGILANSTYPVDFSQRQPAHPGQRARRGARSTTSSGCCSSARRASTRSSPPQPIREDSLLTGHLEPTNDAYAIAKIAGILQRPGRAPPVRPALDLGDADEPLRPGRQLLADGLARAARADPPLRRGGRPRRAGASRTGAPARRAASSCTSTTWPTPACTCWSTTTAPDQVNVGTGTDVTIREIAETDRRRRRLRRARPSGTRPSPTARRRSCST